MQERLFPAQPHVDVSYVASAEKYKSKQTVRERLGKVIEMYGKRRGLFQSPTRGLVIYDADTAILCVCLPGKVFLIRNCTAR